AALAGDGAPLLRLAGGAQLNGSLAGGWPANLYSVGHVVAVPCTDYPQPFDMLAAQSVRTEQYNAAVAALPADQFAPFTNTQWLNNPIQDYNQCLPWPAPTHTRVLDPYGLPLVPADVPVLILAGDLDSVTAMGGAEVAQTQLGPSARLVVLPNSTHVAAQGDIVGCGSSMVRAFILNPQNLMSLDTSCTASFPEIRAVGVFPQTLDQMPLPTATEGNAASESQLRLAAVAVATVGDAVAHAPARGKKGLGLRGGTVSATGKKPKKGQKAKPAKARRRERSGPLILQLKGARYASDVAVSGRVTVPKDPHAAISAKVTATVDSGERVTLTISWLPLEPHALATAQGSAGRSTALRITAPAP
ncbi:MAG: alpha/beta hydrolase, partial [Thermomicrobiales bacterium]